MREILESKLTIISGWGSGLAIIFCFFNNDIELFPEKVEYLDIAMSASTLIFIICIANAIFTGMVLAEGAKKRKTKDHQS